MNGGERGIRTAEHAAAGDSEAVSRGKTATMAGLACGGGPAQLTRWRRGSVVGESLTWSITNF